MRQIKDIMSGQVQCVDPKTDLREIAKMMKELDSGAIPVCDQGRLTGMVTDRDIVIKTLANGLDAYHATAADVMSAPIVYCFEDDDIGEAARLMEVKQIRRLVVLDRAKKLVGILSLGDISVRASEELSGEILEKVSEKDQERKTA